MISRSISTSRKLSRVTDRTALLFTWIQPHTDDYGRMEGDAFTVKAKVVPMRDWSEDDVEACLKEMHQAGLIVRYEVDEELVLEVINFEEHQTFRGDRARQEEYPKMPEGAELTYEREKKEKQPVVDNGIPKTTNAAKRRTKLSQVKVSKGKVILTAPQSDAGPGVLVNDLISGFKEVNPSYARLFAQIPQRKALERMLEQHGQEKMRGIIAYLPKSNASQYAPTITTPVQLEHNLGKLIAWAAKARDKAERGNGKGKEILI